MSNLAFFMFTQLKEGMEVTILEPKCASCGLWQLVKSGRISKLESKGKTQSVKLGRTSYDLTYATGYKVAPADKAIKWLALAKSIVCTHN